MTYSVYQYIDKEDSVLQERFELIGFGAEHFELNIRRAPALLLEIFDDERFLFLVAYDDTDTFFTTPKRVTVALLPHRVRNVAVASDRRYHQSRVVQWDPACFEAQDCAQDEIMKLVHTILYESFSLTDQDALEAVADMKMRRGYRDLIFYQFSTDRCDATCTSDFDVYLLEDGTILGSRLGTISHIPEWNRREAPITPDAPTERDS